MLEVIIGAVIGVAGTILLHFLNDKRDEKNKLREKQKSINHVTLALSNIRKIANNQLEPTNQWLLSYSDYEFKFEKDLAKAIEDNFEDLKGLSGSTAEYLRKLRIELNNFVEFIENQNEISRKQAKKIFFKEGKNYLEENNSNDFFFLTENQRYHKWNDFLISIEDLSQKLAFHLISHSLQKDTKNKLKSIAEV